MKTSNNSAKDLDEWLGVDLDNLQVNVNFSMAQLLMAGGIVFVAMYLALMLAKLTKVGG